MFVIWLLMAVEILYTVLCFPFMLMIVLDAVAVCDYRGYRAKTLPFQMADQPGEHQMATVYLWSAESITYRC